MSFHKYKNENEVYIMSKQIFKMEPPIALLTNLLDKICEPSQNYCIDMNAYKKMRFHNYHTEFLSSLVPYYHWSKQFYLQRELTIYTFMTIIRQLCRLYKIEIHTFTNSTVSYCIDKNIGLS